MEDSAILHDHSQFEERIGNLQHQDVRVSVVMYYQYSFDCASHAEIFVVVLETLQACGNRGVLFWLCFFRANEKKRG